MHLQIGLAMRHRLGGGAGSGGSGGSGTPALFTAVDAGGWTATYPSPPTLDPVGAPENFTVTRAGFTPAGAATTYSDLLTVTKRLRQAYPNQASLTPSTVVLSDYVYAGDTVLGAGNNSTEASPKPVAHWVTPGRTVVGDSLTLEVVAFHRNARQGEQVACVEFSATDGTTTVTQKVSASSLSPRASDRCAVIVYRAVMNITTLADQSPITCNAKVYPWFGTSASVRDSAAASAGREFSPRVYLKHTAKAANPPFAYVSTAGNDTTGVVSTSAATASATPFATVVGAIKGLKAATGVTGGRIDGCLVRLMAGSFVAGSLAAGDVTGGIQDHAAVTITRDPNAAKSAAILTFGAAAPRPRFPYLRIADCTVQRTGTQAFTGESGAPLQLVLDDVTFDNASNNASVLATANLWVYGCDLQNATSSPFAAGSNEVRMIRGLLNASGVTVENWLVVGSRLTGGNHSSGLLSNGTRSSNGAICAFNYFSGYRPAYGGLAETMEVAVVQNVIEFFSATSNTGLGMSPDSNLSNMVHAVVHHNTVAGFWNNGRTNNFYDEHPSTARTHRLVSSAGNIHVSLNTKSDIFLLDGTRTGNWPFAYGVGVRSEFHQFDAAAPNFRQEFSGLGSVVGTSTTTALSPQFTAPAATTSGPTAGAGGGTYTLQAGSPAKGIVSKPMLRFDLAGNARSATAASAGAYE
ncbi:MAG: hypothetical protein ACKVPY_01500 [Paracoccaceae bacterium]